MCLYAIILQLKYSSTLTMYGRVRHIYMRSQRTRLKRELALSTIILDRKIEFAYKDTRFKYHKYLGNSIHYAIPSNSHYSLVKLH